jgi:hypothetical protein
MSGSLRQATAAETPGGRRELEISSVNIIMRSVGTLYIDAVVSSNIYSSRNT